MSLLERLVESVHDVRELVVQQVAVLVLLELVGDQPLLEALVVLRDLVLVLRVDLHAELVLHLAVVHFFMLHLEIP